MHSVVCLIVSVELGSAFSGLFGGGDSPADAPAEDQEPKEEVGLKNS